MDRKDMISIWFFIGVLLLAYGVLILGAGIYELVSPPAHPWCWPNCMPASGGALLLFVIGAGLHVSIRTEESK